MIESAQFKTKRDAEHAAKRLRHNSYSGLVLYHSKGRGALCYINVHSAIPEQLRRDQHWQVRVRFSTQALTSAWGYLAKDGNINVQPHRPMVPHVKAIDKAVHHGDS